MSKDKKAKSKKTLLVITVVQIVSLTIMLGLSLIVFRKAILAPETNLLARVINISVGAFFIVFASFQIVQNLRYARSLNKDK